MKTEKVAALSGPDEDAGLMLAFQQGDENAFLLLLKKYEDRLVNFTYRYAGNRAGAEDLAQEVLVKLYKARDTYKPSAHFSTWLYTIATNACLDYKRRSLRDLLRRAVPFSFVDEDGQKEREVSDVREKPLDQSLEQQQKDDAIRSALQRLPPQQRLALMLKTYEDKPYSEIAGILRCSVPAVESLLFRARQTLKQYLSSLDGS
ncbi:MAG TPA: RNA polymerase sigma factor [bacterium]|nr:RNA polymerase sigma factor [bacterium]